MSKTTIDGAPLPAAQRNVAPHGVVQEVQTGTYLGVATTVTRTSKGKKADGSLVFDPITKTTAHFVDGQAATKDTYTASYDGIKLPAVTTKVAIGAAAPTTFTTTQADFHAGTDEVPLVQGKDEYIASYGGIEIPGSEKEIL